MPVRVVVVFCNKINIIMTNDFLRFLATSHESIFVRPVNPNDLYKVRDGIKFHLYINTAPCGDARIFSPHEDDICIDKHPNR